MKNLLIILLTLAPAFFVSAASSKADARAHEGVWKPVAAVLGGAPLPQPVLAAITLKIMGTNYEVTVQGERPDQGTCTLDKSTSPKRMTITSTNGANMGKTFLAIYEMKDDQSLRICYDLSGAAFPKDFDSPKGTKHYLADYRRQKPEAPAAPAQK
jgi:uncharacterized protein (TIGR03067 family)